MALVTVDYLLARPGLEGVDSGKAQAAIDDASSLVVDAVKPLLDAATPDTTPVAVKTVVVAMCRRYLTNPSGHAQESLGDYSYATGGSAVATLYMTAREKRIVRRAVGQSGVGSAQAEGYLPYVPDTADDEESDL